MIHLLRSLVPALAVLAVSCDAAEDATIFSWRAAVSVLPVSGTLYRAHIPAVVLNECREFPADLRVVDSSGAAWPFFVWPTGDDAPQFVVFEAEGGGKPVLYFGSARAPMPHYDLMRRVSEEQITNAPVIQITDIRPNPKKIASGLGLYARNIGLMVAVIVGGFFLLALAKYLRRAFGGE